MTSASTSRSDVVMYVTPAMAHRVSQPPSPAPPPTDPPRAVVLDTITFATSARA